MASGDTVGPLHDPDGCSGVAAEIDEVGNRERCYFSYPQTGPCQQQHESSVVLGYLVGELVDLGVREDGSL